MALKLRREVQTVVKYLKANGEQCGWRVFFTKNKSLARSIINQDMKRLNASRARYRFATHVESNWYVEEERTITK